jgi:hypothetical protein
MMNNSTTSDMIRQMMDKEKKPDRSGDMPEKVLDGNLASTIRRDRDGKTFVWYDQDQREDLPWEAPDSAWMQKGAVKVYGDFSKYGVTGEFLRDAPYAIRRNSQGDYEIDDVVQMNAMGGDGFQYEQFRESKEYAANRGMGLKQERPDQSRIRTLLDRLQRYNPDRPYE